MRALHRPGTRYHNSLRAPGQFRASFPGGNPFPLSFDRIAVPAVGYRVHPYNIRILCLLVELDPKTGEDRLLVSATYWEAGSPHVGSEALKSGVFIPVPSTVNGYV